MKLNRTTMRTVDILKLVSKNPDGITLDGICEKLELPKTSAYDIVTTLVEMGIDVARDANSIHKPALMMELKDHAEQVTILRRTTCTGIHDHGIVCRDADGRELTLDADTVILAAGMAPLRAEALALEPVPHILVLDEPLSGVDIEGEHQLLEMLDELRTEYDLSILLSTHDFATLGQFADKVILLNKRVLRMGPPEEVTSSPEFYETFHLRMGKGGEG